VVGLITFAVYANDRIADADADARDKPGQVAFVRRHEDALYVAGGTRRDAPGTEFEPELYGVDPADGSLRSRVSAGVGLNPVGAGDTGYLATETGVHAFATGDGEPTGSHRFEDHSLVPAVSPGAIVGDLVVHPTWRGLLALGPS